MSNLIQPSREKLVRAIAHLAMAQQRDRAELDRHRHDRDRFLALAYELRIATDPALFRKALDRAGLVLLPGTTTLVPGWFADCFCQSAVDQGASPFSRDADPRAN